MCLLKVHLLNVLLCIIIMLYSIYTIHTLLQNNSKKVKAHSSINAKKYKSLQYSITNTREIKSSTKVERCVVVNWEVTQYFSINVQYIITHTKYYHSERQNQIKFSIINIMIKSLPLQYRNRIIMMSTTSILNKQLY